MTDPTTPSELRGALAGDEAALSRLVAAWTPVVQSRVARVLLRRGAGQDPRRLRQEVEDLVQEVFLALFADAGKTLRDWRPDRGLPLDAFVGLVAERRTISLLRSRKRQPWQEEPVAPEVLDGAGSAPGSERIVASRQQLRRLLGQLREELSPLGWRLFRLLYVEELSVAEVVQREELSAEAVYAWRSRLRRRAHRLLRAETPETDPPRRRGKRWELPWTTS